MGKLFHAVIVGVIGAAIVHIAILLMVPAFSVRDAWSSLSQRSNYYTMTRLDQAAGPPLIETIDPLFLASACRFDLNEGIVHLTGEGKVSYWSISVHDRTGQNVFSLNDRSSSSGHPDFVIATSDQMVAIRNALPPEMDRSVFIEADVGEGIVVVRAFAPDESWHPTVSAFLQSMKCLSK